MLGFVFALVAIALWERGQAPWPAGLQGFKRVTDAIAIGAGFAAAWAVADLFAYQDLAWQSAAALGALAGRALIEPLRGMPAGIE